MMKKFWKSVKIWQSYGREFSGLLFWPTLYSKRHTCMYCSRSLLCCWMRTEVIQPAPDIMDRYTDLQDGLPVLPAAPHPYASYSDSKRRVYTLTLPMSNGTCHHRSSPDTLPICSMIQSSPLDRSATIDSMSLPNSKRVHFARPID